MQVDKTRRHGQAGDRDSPFGTQAAGRADFGNTVTANEQVGDDRRFVIAAEDRASGKQPGCFDVEFTGRNRTAAARAENQQRHQAERDNICHGRHQVSDPARHESGTLVKRNLKLTLTGS